MNDYDMMKEQQNYEFVVRKTFNETQILFCRIISDKGECLWSFQNS